LTQLASQPVLRSWSHPSPRVLVVGDVDDLPLCVQELIATRELPVVLYAANCRQACQPSLLTQVDVILLCQTNSQTNNPSNIYQTNTPTEFDTAIRLDLSAEDGSLDGQPDGQQGEPLDGRHNDYQLLVDALASHRLTSIVLSSNSAGVGGGVGIAGDVFGDDDACFVVPADVSADELWGRLTTVQQCRAQLNRMRDQVTDMRRLGKKLKEQFVEVDQELRLASRLQRDFLPKQLPAVGDIQFHTLFQPATWVSGDVYDVQRLDENVVGFYVADAVGHGVAAGLLTMFIKRAIVGKVVSHDGYDIVSPGKVLERLNLQLIDQHLSHCQFVTACYGTVNLQTREVTIARGGHPNPLLIRANGSITEVECVGGLLGIFEDEMFPTTSLVLEPGDKLMFYSDGLDDLIFRAGRREGPSRFSPEFLKLAENTGSDFIRGVEERLNNMEGSLQPNDDITLLVLEAGVRLFDMGS